MLKKIKLLAVALVAVIIAAGLFSGCDIFNEVIDFDSLRYLDGVKITAEKSKYETGTTEVSVTWKNDTEKTLIFGEAYYLVRKDNSGWVKLSMVSNVAFTSLGYVLEPHSQRNHTYDLAHAYKKSDLKAGTYRVVTDFFNNADTNVTSDDAYWLYAEFEFVKNDKVEKEILKAYVANYNKGTDSGKIKVADISIGKYYGEFNGSHVVTIHGPWGYAAVLTTESAGGITFYYGSAGPYILVYNNGTFNRLNDAYSKGLLTVNDLKVIANIHNYGIDREIDINDFSPQKSDFAEVDFTKYTAKYYNSIKIKDGFLRFGSLWAENSNSSALHVVSKFDFDGKKIWDKPSTASGNTDKIYELPNDEGFLVYSEYYRYYIVKYDIDGNEEWTVNARFYKALLMEEDGFVVAFGGTDLCAVKVDFDWNIVKYKNLELPLNVGSIIKLPAGYALCGHSGDWYDFSEAVLVDNDFNFIKTENEDFTSIESYVALDDGFVAVCKTDYGVYGELKKFDYNLKEIWSLNLKYPTANNTYGNVEFVDIIRVNDGLYVAGHSTVRNGQPFALKLDFDGNILWESGLLTNKGEVHQALGIYKHGNGVVLLTMYNDFDLKPANFECIYYEG